MFLFFHPGLSGILARHPGVAAEEVNGGPFETFGFVDGGEGEFARFGWVVVREEGFNLGIELFDRGNRREPEDGLDRGDLVFEEGEFERGELGGLLGEVFG